MDGLIRLAFSVLTQVASSEPFGARLTRGGMAAALAVLALVTILGAIACFCAVLWIYLIPIAGPVGAPAIVGGILLGVAAIVLLIGFALLRRKRSPASTVEALVEAIKTGDVSQLMHDHKAVLLLFALLTGVTAATKLSKAATRRKKAD